MDTFDIKYLIGCWDVIFVLLFQGGNTLARPRGPRFKVARRFGVNVCAHPKALKRGATQVRKQSDYGKQLNEKQKLKAYYDMQEKQFANWVEAAMSAKGNAGENLVQRLECRLDNLVYRLGFGSTLRQARQMVVHHHILVNGKSEKPISYLEKTTKIRSSIRRFGYVGKKIV